MNKSFSRRSFLGSAAALAGYAAMRPSMPAWAQQAAQEPVVTAWRGGDFDTQAKLCFNENNYGPSPAVLKAMSDAFKYANRYGYPDGGLTEMIASMNYVTPNNVLLGAGSTEILEIVAEAFVTPGKKVIGVEPTFGSVYEFATGLRGNSIRVPLLADYRQDIPGIIKSAKENAKDVAFIYICNPNNPTGNVVTKTEVKQLLDEIPEGIPVLMDEAYHHFVETPDYATSMPHVAAGRSVIVTRTFSKIAALAGIRLGYAVAPANLIQRMRPYSGAMSTSAVAKLAGVASLNDIAGEKKVKADILASRKQTIGQLEGMGYKVIPSEANFFMVNLKRQVGPVIQAFRTKNVLVGRQFPPMTEFLRVSIGTDDEMKRFMTAFKEIMA